MEFPLKPVLESVLIGVVSALLVMALIFIPILNMAVLLFPVPLVVIGVRRGLWAGVLALVISSGLLSFMVHPFLGPILFTLNIFLVTGLSWGFKKKLGMHEFIVLSAGGVLVALLASLQVFSWLVGQSFFEYLLESLRSFFTTNSENLDVVIDLYYKLGILDQLYSAEQFVEVMIGQIRDLLPMVPSLLLVLSLVFGGLNFLISRMVLRRFRGYVPYVPPFSDWALPKGTGRGFLAILIVSMLGALTGIKNFNVVFYTILSLFSFVFALQGLAVSAFFLKQGRIPGVLRVIILIVAFIFASMALTFLGIFEQIFHLRRAYANHTRG